MRRHRLNTHEIDPVKEAVENELQVLCQERRDEPKARKLFCVWWRIKTHCQGQPAYPKPLTWNTMASYLYTGMEPFLLNGGGVLNYAVKVEGST